MESRDDSAGISERVPGWVSRLRRGLADPVVLGQGDVLVLDTENIAVAVGGEFVAELAPPRGVVATAEGDVVPGAVLDIGERASDGGRNRGAAERRTGYTKQ